MEGLGVYIAAIIILVLVIIKFLAITKSGFTKSVEEHACDLMCEIERMQLKQFDQICIEMDVSCHKKGYKARYYGAFDRMGKENIWFMTSGNVYSGGGYDHRVNLSDVKKVTRILESDPGYNHNPMW